MKQKIDCRVFFFVNCGFSSLLLCCAMFLQVHREFLFHRVSILHPFLPHLSVSTLLRLFLHLFSWIVDYEQLAIPHIGADDYPIWPPNGVWIW
jgi:hypothetical protein